MIEFDKFFCHCELVRIQREANFWAPVAFVLTARQYGEVVLPDEASGHRSRYPPEAGPVSCPGARRVWRTFCRPGTKFCGHYECRGTRLIGGREQVKVH